MLVCLCVCVTRPLYKVWSDWALPENWFPRGLGVGSQTLVADSEDDGSGRAFNVGRTDADVGRSNTNAGARQHLQHGWETIGFLVTNNRQEEKVEVGKVGVEVKEAGSLKVGLFEVYYKGAVVE